MKMDVLSEIKAAPAVSVPGFGLGVPFVDLFQALHVRYGLDNKDLLEVELERLAREGFVKLFYCDEILCYVTPV